MTIRFNYSEMKKVCTAPIKDFAKYGQVTETKDGMYVFCPDFNKGAKKQKLNNRILAVAHLDHVLNLNHFYKLVIDDDICVLNANLDDRLGAYILLSVLPRYNVQYDLLLTEGEEEGRSTAGWFFPPVDYKYNWMFSFDRQGTDVVAYQFDNPNLRKLLKDVGLHMAIGSFSDIAFLDHLGCRGINVGTGYHDEHTDMCHAIMWETKSNIRKFLRFYARNANTSLPYTLEDRYVRAYGNRWDSKKMPRNTYGNWEGTDGGPWWKELEDDETDRARFYNDDMMTYSDKFMNGHESPWDDPLECVVCGEAITSKNRTALDYVCTHCEANVVNCTVCYGLVLDSDTQDGVCAVCRARM